jgi:hypothetical protein
VKLLTGLQSSNDLLTLTCIQPYNDLQIQLKLTTGFVQWFCWLYPITTNIFTRTLLIIQLQKLQFDNSGFPDNLLLLDQQLKIAQT